VNDSLANRVIAIAETRELDVFAGLLERRGATVLRYPLIQIIDAPDPKPILAWIRCAIEGGFEDLILLTGEGLRRLLHCIDTYDATLRSPFIAALQRMRKITRGPKPARALRELGLSADLPAQVPTTHGVIETLRPFDLRGRRIGVQLYGEEPNLPLVEFLRSAGAQAITIAPYRYAQGATQAAVTELLERMRSGEIDAIAFTSKAQVERLFRGTSPALVRAALGATQVAAVGPLVSDALRSHGVTVRAMPDDSWFLKPLTSALAAMLAGQVE
jgi:uroporphyrinogen-III synthase